jgi:hypothetical protein
MNKRLPRHSASSVELKEGTGPITAMCPCGDFLEIYKVDKTFRVKTPETIDPAETNPNAPWVASPVDDLGSSHPIVARVLLQGHEILKSALFDGEVDKDGVTKQLHACKESLVACEKIAKRVGSHIDRVIQEVIAYGVSTDNSGRTLNPFPQVPDLDTDCGTFLIQANRAIKLICELPRFFIPLDRDDSNFDYLGKRLAATLGESAPLTEFVTANADGIRYLIDLRNFHEHPKEKRTVVDNFRVMPDARIRVPMWHLAEREPRPIKEEMFAALEFLIQMAEAMLIHLVMHKVSKQFPFIVEEIPDEDIDRNTPIRYRLSIDASKLRLG